MLGKRKRAIELYEKAVEINPNDADAWLFVGGAYGRLGYFFQEIECYETVLTLNPDHQRAKRDLKKATDCTPFVF